MCLTKKVSQNRFEYYRKSIELQFTVFKGMRVRGGVDSKKIRMLKGGRYAKSIQKFTRGRGVKNWCILSIVLFEWPLVKFY